VRGRLDEGEDWEVVERGVLGDWFWALNLRCSVKLCARNLSTSERGSLGEGEAEPAKWGLGEVAKERRVGRWGSRKVTYDSKLLSDTDGKTMLYCKLI
jgi:hypothetical protein